jgi:FkbM family methyltransferase
VNHPTNLGSNQKLFDRTVRVKIVDVGANPVDGDPPYKAMLASGAADLVGFEPDPLALETLNGKKGPNETYLPYAVADGKAHTLHICYAPGMTSLLRPNAAILELFQGFSAWGRVTREEIINTIRLDDVTEIRRMDYLKIDIQGGELMVFRNATKRLADCVVIQTEVEFLPMYVQQPLFSDVDQFLRQHGFLFHRFYSLDSRTIKPFLLNNDVYAGGSQVFAADAIFVRDFLKLEALDDEKLLVMAVVMHDIYKSFDLVLRLLLEYDRRNKTQFAVRYMA